MLSISIGSLSLPVERLLLLLSFALAMAVGYFVGREKKQSADGKIALIFISAMVMARVAFVGQYWKEYQSDWWAVIDIRDAGFNVWIGIAVAVILTVVIYARNPKIRKALVSGMLSGLLLWGLVSLSLWAIKDTSQLPKVVVSQLKPNALGGGTVTETVELNSVEAGKPRVINLWATWCPPCRREMPVLEEAQKNHPEIGVVFVNQGEHPAVIQQFLEKESLELHNVVADTKVILGELIGSRALPTTLFLNSDGQIVDAHLGELSKAKLASKLEKITRNGEPKVKSE